MLAIAFVVGAVIGWAVSSSLVGALGGAIVAVVLAFAGQYALGTRSVREAKVAVPVDLTAPTPKPLSAESYAALSLASRNAVVARLVAQASGRSLDEVVDLLPDLMGRTRVQTEAKLRATANVMEASSRGRVDRAGAAAVCAGEVKLAARASVPNNDRTRAAVERNWGGVVDEDTMTTATLTARLPRMDLSISGLIDDAVNGRANLAFVVGTIRKVGEYHAREIAKIR